MSQFIRHVVPFSQTGLLPSLVQDYLDGKCAWLTGYDREEAFDKVLENRIERKFEGRNELVTVLLEQGENLTNAQRKNVESLLSENTFTVTTGHQLNLFTGPLYFIYKIVTTINLAAQLCQEYPDKNFVPVYWMASEDHDIDEINHVFIYGKKVEWKTSQQGAAGRLKCTGINEVIADVQVLLGNSESADKIVDLLKKSYLESNSLSQATRILVNELFGKYGLVIVDADNSKFKKKFYNVIQDDLQNSTAFNLVNGTIREIEKRHYNVQVHPREINLFYLQDNQRWRIVKDGGKYLGLDKDGNRYPLTGNDLEKSEVLSPNVVLRPLYQEMILPNVAYVGGAAEIAYWLEYKKMFEYYSVSYPVLVLRNSVMLVEESVASKIKKLNYSSRDFFVSVDSLSKEFVLKNARDFSTSLYEEKISEIFTELKTSVEDIDTTLSATVEAEKQKMIHSLKALEEKVIRAGKRRHDAAIQNISKIKERLFPNGKLAERTENFLQYYVKYGDGFIEVLINNLEPITDSITIVEEE